MSESTLESTTGKDTQRICKAIKSVYSRLGRREHGLRSRTTSLCATWNVIAIGQYSLCHLCRPKLHRLDTASLVILARLLVEVGLMLGVQLFWIYAVQVQHS